VFNSILFDLDGTLTDPETGIVRCIEYALDKMNVHVSKNTDFLKYIGPPLQLAFADLLNTDEKHIIDRAISFFRERFREKGQYENEVYDGIEPLLKKLVDNGKRLFVATSKPEFFAKNIINHFNLSGYFSGIYGAGLDGTRSNKAELLAFLLKVEKIEPDTAIMIGDRKYDITGAVFNNLSSIGVLWGYGSKAELEAVNATWLCNDVNCLADILI